MTTPAIPNAKVPIADKNSLATYAWQRFFLALQQAGGSINAVVNGQTITVSALELGPGLAGTQSGNNLILKSGLSVVDNGATLAQVSTIVLDGNFEVSGSGQAVTISSPSGSVEVAQNGVLKSEAVALLNFLGNAQVAIIGDKADISVGTAIIESDGTSIATASTLNFGSLFAVQGAQDYAEINFAGLDAYRGTASLGPFIDLDIGGGLAGTIPSGSSTLTLSGTGLEFVDGTQTTSGVFEVVAGAGATFVGSTAGQITLEAPGLISAVSASNGIAASINAGGTLDLSGTLLELVEGTTTLTGIVGIAAGLNVSFSGTSGGVATLNASGGGSGGSALTLSQGTVSISSGDITIGSGLSLSASGILAATGGGGSGIIQGAGPPTLAVAIGVIYEDITNGPAYSGFPATSGATVVQSAFATSTTDTDLTFASAPTVGNWMVAALLEWEHAGANTGWTLVSDASGSNWDGCLVYRQVQAGDGATLQPFATGAAGGFWGLWEISGLPGTWNGDVAVMNLSITGVSTGTFCGNGSAAQANELCLLMVATGSGTAGGTALSITSSGWTTDDSISAVNTGSGGTQSMIAGHGILGAIGSEAGAVIAGYAGGLYAVGMTFLTPGSAPAFWKPFAYS